jgi:hypothetical protein
MIIIGIDQSLLYTAMSVMNEDGSLLECLSIQPKYSGVERLDFITSSVAKVVIDHIKDNLDKDFIIVREGYAFACQSNVIFNLGELGGCIDLTMFKLARNMRSIMTGYSGKISEYSLPPTTWKKFTFGAGNTVKDTTYLLKAFQKTGIEFNNDNDADSYMIASTFVKMRNVCLGAVPVSTLTMEQRMAVIIPKLRKKNKITDRNIMSINEGLVRELAIESLASFTEFKPI